MPSHATHEDARLLLQLYDLRREKRLRQARDFVGRELKFKDFKDFQKRYPDDSKGGLFIGMVLGYWDMACTLVAKGLIDQELFNATNFEHVAVWFKLRPVAEGWRKDYDFPEMMRSLETVAGHHPGARLFEEHTKPKKAGKSGDGAKREKSRLEEKEDDE